MLRGESNSPQGAALGRAVLILCLIGLCAPPAAAAGGPVPFPERLLPLVDDLDSQLYLTYGFDRPVYRERVQYTLAVMEAWQQSAQSARDEALLEGWLHDAIDRSLPGRRTRLAPIPAFTSPVETAISGVESMRFVEEPVETAARPDSPTIRPPNRRRAEAPQVPATSSAEHDLLPPAVGEPIAASPAAEQFATDQPVLPPAQVDAPALPLLAPAGSTRDLPPAAVAALPRDWAVVQGPHRAATPVRVELDLNEYAARLAGHRLGLRRIEARMLERSTLTADELARLVGELESLDNQRGFLALYAALLPEEVKATFDRPASAAEPIAMLQNFIENRRAALAGRTSGRVPAKHAHELERLERLAERVSRLAEADSLSSQP